MKAQPVDPYSQDDAATALVNLEAEIGLLGALMNDNHAVAKIVERVEATDFAEPLHQRLFQQIVALVEAGKVANPITLRPYFEDDPAIRDLGGVGYLAGMTATFSTVLVAGSLAEQIRDLSSLRRLAEIGRKIAQLATSLDGELDPKGRLAAAEALLNDASEAERGSTTYSIAQSWDRAIADADAEADGTNPQGVKFVGFSDLNKIGVEALPKDLVILAGRPAMGKTAVAIRAAVTAASAGEGVSFYSLEMGDTQLAIRVIADQIFHHGKSPSFTNLRKGVINQADRNEIAKARDRIETMPLLIHDLSYLNVATLPARIRRDQRRLAARGHTLKLVIIDYLQLLTAKSNDRFQEVSAISRALKSAAKETGVCIMALSQLSRKVEERDDKHPTMSDLRESGQIEQDADVIAFVYRDQYYLEMAGEPTDPRKVESWHDRMAKARDKVEIYSAKVRQGRTTKRTSHYFLSSQAIRDADYFNTDEGWGL